MPKSVRTSSRSFPILEKHDQTLLSQWRWWWLNNIRAGSFRDVLRLSHVNEVILGDLNFPICQYTEIFIFQNLDPHGLTSDIHFIFEQRNIWWKQKDTHNCRDYFTHLLHKNDDICLRSHLKMLNTKFTHCMKMAWIFYRVYEKEKLFSNLWKWILKICIRWP